MFPILLMRVVAGCSEYDIQAKDAEKPFFDVGDTGDPTGGDTDRESGPVPTDSAEPQSCTVELATPRNETDDTCGSSTSTPPADAWSLTVEWTWGGTTEGLISTPVVGDLDGDGAPEVVVISGSDTAWTSDIVVLDGATGAEEWSIADAAYHAAGVAIGDIDGDGFGDIVTFAGDYTNAELVAYDATGALLWRTAVDTPFSRTYPSIVDLEGDGDVEILATDLIVDGATGTIEATLEISNATSAASIPVAADLDLDGVQEILYDTRVFEADGTLRWQCGLTSGYYLMAQPIDADGDPYGEVLVTDNLSGMTLCDDDGTELWSVGSWGFPGAVADFDGDGALDFANAGYEGVSVRHGADGAKIWQQARSTDVSGAAGVVSWDVDADGVPEILHAGDQALSILDGATGDILAEYEHFSVTFFETPTVADVDGDGHGEILLASNYVGAALTVLGGASDDWPPAAAVYNEYNYDGANVREDLSIPATRTPPWQTAARVFRGQPSATWSVDLPNASAAITDVCVASCDAGAYAAVAVQVWSDGAEDMPAGTTVDLYAEQSGAWTWIAGSTLPDALPAGASVELVFEVTADAIGTSLEARVDASDTVTECHADPSDTVESPCAR